MKRLIAFSDKLSDFGGNLSGIMMLIGLVLVVSEILVRGLFSRTLYITEEYTGYLMAGLTYVALGYTLKEKGHIRMTFLLTHLSERGRLVLEMICFAIGFAFSVGLTYVTFMFFWDSLISGSRSMQVSGTPLAIPQFFLPLGAFIMTLQFLAEFLKALKALKGKLGDKGEN